MSKLLSGILMISGTSIGAAMLAMPIAAASIGFLMSISYILVIAIVMAYAAFMMVQIYKNTGKVCSIATIAGNNLGKGWKTISSIAILVLLYSLIIAYISGLSETAVDSTDILDYKSFVIVISSVLFLSLALSNKTFDIYNKIAFLLKVVFIIIMTYLLGGNLSYKNLISSNHIDASKCMSILPVFITSFGFHGSIPFIFKYLNDDVVYKKSVIYGNSLTLIIYSTWLLLTFGVLSQQTILSTNNHLSEFINLLNDTTQSAIFNKSISIFCILAILTSLFGVANGLFDFISEFIKIDNRFIGAGVVFFIPMIVCLFDKSLFINALGFAGVALTIIAIIIPSMISFKLKLNHRLILCIMMILGILTILGELMIFY